MSKVIRKDKKMKRNIITIIAALALMGVNAAPVRNAITTYTQPDGSVITLRLCGDEYYHYYTTEDGTPVTLCDDGYYRYTTIDNDNNLKASSIAVGKGESLDAENSNRVVARHKEMHRLGKTRRVEKIKEGHAPMRQAVKRKSDENAEVKGLIIMAEFQDKKFKVSQSTINDMMNKEGYTDKYGSIGSARDYFIAQSYGQFQPNFDVVGPITLSQNLKYYGGNDEIYDQDIRPDVMVSEACELASEQGLVDMSDYDLNGDGWVDLVYVVYAGYSESVSGVADEAIWPHAWYIYQGAQRVVEIDGVKLDAYACSSELYGSYGNKPDGIGTFCHEYSHTLGLPDMYDIDYSGGDGMQLWSIMDEGCNTGSGYVPIGYSAYERAYCGWLELNELTEAASITMPDIKNDKNAAYKISTTVDPNQYITLESRAQEGWDKFLPAAGMMVVAIDYNEAVWKQNAPNDNPRRQRIKLIPADNDFSLYSLGGDLYPIDGNNSLTSSSVPRMQVYNTTIFNKPITNITFKDGITTFDFKGGSNSVEEVSTGDAHIYYNGNEIVMRNSQASEAHIYNLQGMLVATVAIANGEASYTPTHSGLYVVRCNNQCVKVSVQ